MLKWGWAVVTVGAEVLLEWELMLGLEVAFEEVMVFEVVMLKIGIVIEVEL